MRSSDNGAIRAQNANFGVSNSAHKRRWRNSNRGSATDFTPASGYTWNDLLKALAHPGLIAWAKHNNYGLIDEVGNHPEHNWRKTGDHYHFGPVSTHSIALGDHPLIQKYKQYWIDLGYSYQ